MFVLSPLLWVVALLIVALVERRTDAVLLALAVATGSMILGVLVLLPGALSRRHRLKEERRA